MPFNPFPGVVASSNTSTSTSGTSGSCSLQCENGGTCLSNATTGQDYCSCTSQWSGPICSLTAQGKALQNFSRLLHLMDHTQAEHCIVTPFERAGALF